MAEYIELIGYTLLASFSILGIRFFILILRTDKNAWEANRRARKRGNPKGGTDPRLTASGPAVKDGKWVEVPGTLNDGAIDDLFVKKRPR